MEYQEMKERLTKALEGMDVTDLEKFKREICIELTNRRRIWTDILKEKYETEGYYDFRSSIDWKDADQRNKLYEKEKAAKKAAETAVREIIRDFTDVACQGVLTGGSARWWWSKLDDPERQNKPTEISDEAKSLSGIMLNHSFWWPNKGRYLDYIDVREHVAAVLHAVSNAEDIVLRDDRTIEEEISMGVSSAAVYDGFRRFYMYRENLEKELLDDHHCGDCIKVACSCSRCIIDDARGSAEEFMREAGWL